MHRFSIVRSLHPFGTCAAIVLLGLGTVPAAEQARAGRVTDVTLYKGQALVTRTIPVEEGAGSLEIVVEGLPANVVPQSLFAEGDKDVTVRAVRFRSRAVGEEPREEVRKLDASLESLRRSLELNRKSQEARVKDLEFLEKLSNFVAPTAEMELSKGVLNAETLETFTTFSFSKRQEIVADQVKLATEAADTEEQISLVERQKAELTSSSSRTVREAALFIEKAGAGPSSVRLNYLVADCGWSPSYVFRADPAGAEVRVECNALVQQITGEDWSNVALTLSTASPALSAAVPGIAPFYVAMLDATQQPQAQQAGAQEQEDLAQQVRSIKQRQAKAIVQNSAALNLDETLGSNWDVNSAANDYQRMELLGGKEFLSSLRMESPDTEDGPSLNYRLTSPVSVASRADQQMVRILEGSLKSRFYHVATPVLSGQVYREAELTNTSQEDLLGGPITVYLGGRFVGRAEIPTVTRGESFVVGFGADPQLRTRRDLVSKTEGVQGGNREINMKYAISIESYRDAPSIVRVFDRLPYSSRAGELRVTLKEPTVALSQDRLYDRRERPKGILRWDAEVPAGATGEKTYTIEYAFTLEFDRKYQLGAPGSSPRLQQEFLEMQRARMNVK